MIHAVAESIPRCSWHSKEAIPQDPYVGIIATAPVLSAPHRSAHQIKDLLFAPAR